MRLQFTAKKYASPVALLLVVASVHTANAWDIVPLSGPAGWDLDLTVDYRGDVHAAYYTTSGTPSYADFTGGGWNIVPTTSSSGFDLQTDRRGKQALAAVSFFNGTDNLVLRTRTSAGTWVPTSVPISGSFADWVGLAFDNMNRPGIAYVDTVSKSLKYATQNGIAWNIQTVATANTFQFGNPQISMTTDSDGRPWFAYESNGGTLTVLKPNGSSWTPIVSPGAYAVGYRGMAVDSQNNLHVAMLQNFDAVTYGRFNGNSWTTTPLGTDGSREVAIALDAQQVPHLGWVKGSSQLYHRTPAGNPDFITSWANPIDGPETAAVAVDRRGAVHVLYGQDSQSVGHARQPGINGSVVSTLKPVFDAQAVSTNGNPYVLTDGGTTMRMFPLTLLSQDERGILEYDLRGLSPHAAIVSAQLTFRVVATTSSGNSAAAFDVFAYTGNGTLEVADATAITRMTAGTEFLFSTGVVTIDLDPAFLQSLAQSSDYLGLVLRGSQANFQNSIATSEFEALSSEFIAPRLIISSIPGVNSLGFSGDTNLDDIVDIEDLGNLANHWQQAGDSWTQGDFNKDGFVDIEDLGILASHWQQVNPSALHPSSAVAIPEPASALLLLIALPLLKRRRRA